MFGNAAADDKKENPKPHKGASDARNTDKLSFSREAGITTNCAQGVLSTCQSLVSTKTLLCGTAATLWGSSVIVRNGPSPQKNNSLVLCSTTVSCLSSPDHLNQPSAEREALSLVGEEESADAFSLETEERCGSYDDVVLESNDDAISGESHFNYADFDADGHLWEESDNTASAASSLEIMREAPSTNELELQRMTSKSAVMSLATKPITSQVNMCNRVNEIRQQTKFIQPAPHFVVPPSITQPSKVNQQKTPLNISMKVQERSKLPHRSSKPNTAPNSSFVRPKVAPKSPFSIYTDPVKPVCTTKGVLTSLAANILYARSNCSGNRGQRVTAPLCSCGRRAKRQVVSNGGPNQGRGFFCCSVRRSGGAGRVQKGCQFFKWESAVMKSNSPASAAGGASVSLCQLNSSFRRPIQRSNRKSC